MNRLPESGGPVRYHLGLQAWWQRQDYTCSQSGRAKLNTRLRSELETGSVGTGLAAQRFVQLLELSECADLWRVFEWARSPDHPQDDKYEPAATYRHVMVTAWVDWPDTPTYYHSSDKQPPDITGWQYLRLSNQGLHKQVGLVEGKWGSQAALVPIWDMVEPGGIEEAIEPFGIRPTEVDEIIRLITA